MADKEQLDRLKQGVDAWNVWRAEAGRESSIDLSGAGLSGSIVGRRYDVGVRRQLALILTNPLIFPDWGIGAIRFA